MLWHIDNDMADRGLLRAAHQLYEIAEFERN